MYLIEIEYRLQDCVNDFFKARFNAQINHNRREAEHKQTSLLQVNFLIEQLARVRLLVNGLVVVHEKEIAFVPRYLLSCVQLRQRLVDRLASLRAYHSR